MTMNGSLRITAAATLAACAFGAAAQEPYQLGIADPMDQAVVSGDQGALVVRAAVVPALGGGDRLELLVDGTPVAKPSDQLEFHLTGIAPGVHVLQTRIIDATGNVGEISPTNILTVVRDLPPQDDPRDAAGADPILDSRWGPGDENLAVSSLHFVLR
jgi:hypothetical protein